MGKIMAGIIGGIVALVGAYALQWAGILATPGTGDTALSESVVKLQGQLTALTSKVENTSAPDLAPLKTRLSQLEAQKKQRVQNNSQSGDAAKANSEKITALAATLTQLQGTQVKLQQSVSSGAAGENAGLSTLAERLTKLENNDGLASDVKSIQTTMAELADKLATLSKTAAKGANNSAISEEVSAVAAKLDAVKGQLSSELEKAGKSLANAETNIKQATEQMAALGQRVDSLETSLNTPRKDEQRVARAMAVAGLKSAIDNGGNFSDALTLFEGLTDNPQSVASLKEYADSGIPDLSSLTTSFAPLSDKIIGAATPKNNDGVMGRFLTNARSLVKVKSIGAIEGNSVEAIVSRIEAALKNADLAVATKEWETLPDTAKTISTGWINQVKARSQANALITNLLKQFMTGTTGTNN
jgi:hypothetical protein